MELRSQEINRFFNRFEEIHEERHKYSLEWAFADAQEQMDSFQNKIVDGTLKEKCTLCKINKIVMKDFSGVQQTGLSTVKKAKLYARLFSNMFLLLSIVEIALSVLLVLGISELSHSGGEALHSEWLSLWIVITFAFIKVFIERFWLKPNIDTWGWKLYAKTSSMLKERVIALNLAADETIERMELKEEDLADFANSFTIG